MIKKKIQSKKKFNFIILLIVITTLSLLIKINLYSNDKFRSHNKIILLGNENLAPIIYNEKGKTKGVAVDIAKEIGKRIGCKIEVKGVNWDEAQNLVLLDEADALLQINPNFEREEKYDFSDELLESEFCIFINSTNTNIKNINDLKNKTVGIEKAGYPYNILQNYNGIKINLITDWKKGFEDIISGRLDAIIVDRWIGEYELAENRVKGIRVIDKPMESQYSRIAVKKGNKELLNLIDTGLKEIKDDGTMNNILNNWKGKRVIYFTENRLINTALYLLVIFIVFILLISLYWIKKLSRLSKKLEYDVKQRTEELYNTNQLLLQANAELKKISTTDELTEIHNRRYFDSLFQKIWEVSVKERKPLSIIMIDIDNFKIFNDTYGHLVGDRCLKSVAEVIKSVVKREGDLVARFGGEEFIVMLSNTTEKDALVIAESMRVQVERLAIKNEKIDSVITISLGVAVTIPDIYIKPYDLINRADKLLYKGKESGRNKVIS